MSHRPSRAGLSRFSLVELESRLVPAAPNPTPVPAPPPSQITVPDFSGAYQLENPTALTLFGSVVDPNPGATLDYNTIQIVTPPTKGQVSVNRSTGVVVYTPNYLLQNLPQPYPNLIPESFTFRIGDSAGAVSNVATATFTGFVAPAFNGPILAGDGYALTTSLTAVTVDTLSRVVVNDGGQVVPASVAVDTVVGTPDDVLSKNPSAPLHGTTSVNPATGEVTYTPDLGFTGFDFFTYTVRDTLGNEDRGHVYVVVNASAAPQLRADPFGGTMLLVDGTTGNDTILVTPGGRPGDVAVSVNGVSSGPFRPTGRLVVQGLDGDDRLQVSDRVLAPAWLVGGIGNDTLVAGGGTAALLGGDGADNLVSGKGGDLLVGGTGSDTLIGTGNDIVVAGSTAFDTDPGAVRAIQREWTSSHPYAQRVLNLTGQVNRQSANRLNGDVFLSYANVFDDGVTDTVYLGGDTGLNFTTVGGATGDNLLDSVLPTPVPPPPARPRHDRDGRRPAPVPPVCCFHRQLRSGALFAEADFGDFTSRTDDVLLSRPNPAPRFATRR